jgi:hypothetical protein
MDTLLRMQAAFDIAKTRKRAGKIRVRPYRNEELPARDTVRQRER